MSLRRTDSTTANGVVQNVSPSVLPEKEFDSFLREIEAPGKIIPGLAKAIKESKDSQKDAD